MRLRRRHLVLLVLPLAAVAAIPAIAIETDPTVQAVNVGGIYGTTHYWSPDHVEIAAGGTATLSNPTTTPHGVEWISTLKPSCEEGTGKVPVGTTVAASGTEWSGKCTFTQAGTYTFYCTVHHAEMTGTVTVTIPGAPIVTTGEASAVGETTATLKGTVNPQGKATTYHFSYGTSASYGKETPEESAGEESAGKSVSIPVGSLLPGTTYHYQLVAKNTAGTMSGQDETFTTPSPPGPPSATTGQATEVSETAATLNGTINPDGQATTYLFEWGTDSSYGHKTSELPAGEDHNGHSKQATLGELSAGTLYHFRLVAENKSGPVDGEDRTFTTTTAPKGETPQQPAGGSTTPTGGGNPTATSSKGPASQTKTEPVGSPLFGSLKLASAQHGGVIHGSLVISDAGSAGHLEIDLLTKGTATAGKFLRTSLHAGKLSFAVALSTKAKHTLKAHHRLALNIKVLLTPVHGKALILTRMVVMRS